MRQVLGIQAIRAGAQLGTHHGEPRGGRIRSAPVCVARSCLKSCFPNEIPLLYGQVTVLADPQEYERGQVFACFPFAHAAWLPASS